MLKHHITNSYTEHFALALFLKKNVTFRKLSLLPSSDKRISFTLRMCTFIKPVVCEYGICGIKVLCVRHLCRCIYKGTCCVLFAVIGLRILCQCILFKYWGRQENPTDKTTVLTNRNTGLLHTNLGQEVRFCYCSCLIWNSVNFLFLSSVLFYGVLNLLHTFIMLENQDHIMMNVRKNKN
jgi:hypothetical protein